MDALKSANMEEIQRLRAQPSDFRRALAWLSEAREFVARYPHSEPAARSADEHAQYLLRVRQALEKADLHP
jgi:hypothetical protein